MVDGGRDYGGRSRSRRRGYDDRRGRDDRHSGGDRRGHDDRRDRDRGRHDDRRGSDRRREHDDRRDRDERHHRRGTDERRARDDRRGEDDRRERGEREEKRVEEKRIEKDDDQRGEGDKEDKRVEAERDDGRGGDDKAQKDDSPKKPKRKSKWDSTVDDNGVDAMAAASASPMAASAGLMSIMAAPTLFPPPDKLKDELCLQFTEGQCSKGTDCPLAHSLRELKPGGLKPKLCPTLRRGSECPRPSVCLYAHTKEELPVNFKCTMCHTFTKGNCRTGGICKFAHGEEERQWFTAFMGDRAGPQAAAGPHDLKQLIANAQGGAAALVQTGGMMPQKAAPWHTPKLSLANNPVLMARMAGKATNPAGPQGAMGGGVMGGGLPSMGKQPGWMQMAAATAKGSAPAVVMKGSMPGQPLQPGFAQKAFGGPPAGDNAFAEMAKQFAGMAKSFGMMLPPGFAAMTGNGMDAPNAGFAGNGMAKAGVSVNGMGMTGKHLPTPMGMKPGSFPQTTAGGLPLRPKSMNPGFQVGAGFVPDTGFVPDMGVGFAPDAGFLPEPVQIFEPTQVVEPVPVAVPADPGVSDPEALSILAKLDALAG